MDRSAGVYSATSSGCSALLANDAEDSGAGEDTEPPEDYEEAEEATGDEEGKEDYDALECVSREFVL